MAVGQRVRGRHGDVLAIFLWSRAAIWLGAIFAFAAFEPNRHPQAGRWDSPAIHDLGWALDLWARWDSVFFVRIAERGYDTGSAAFFPLYPAAVQVLGRVFFDHFVLAGTVISLACCLASFHLLHRLAEERLGTQGAHRAVLYLAVFPTALFLQAVYSESLFLLSCLGAFALAERGRFAGAGAVAGLALLTRPNALALVPPLALLAWRSRNRLQALAGLAVALPVAAVYPLYLWHRLDDPWAFARAQELWHRHLSPLGPLGGIWDALTRWTPPGADPRHAVAVNAQALAFLVLFTGLSAVAWRRFGAPYGLFCVLSLAIPLSEPSSRWPLLSLPRFGLAVFPFFLALAWLGGRPRVHTAIVAVSSIMLGIATAQWALWQWVA